MHAAFEKFKLMIGGLMVRTRAGLVASWNRQ